MENYTLKEKTDNDFIFIIKHITIPFYFISTVMLFLNIQPCHTILHLKVPVIWDIIRNCKYHKKTYVNHRHILMRQLVKLETLQHVKILVKLNSEA